MFTEKTLPGNLTGWKTLLVYCPCWGSNPQPPTHHTSLWTRSPKPLFHSGMASMVNFWICSFISISFISNRVSCNVGQSYPRQYREFLKLMTDLLWSVQQGIQDFANYSNFTFWHFISAAIKYITSFLGVKFLPLPHENVFCFHLGVGYSVPGLSYQNRRYVYTSYYSSLVGWLVIRCLTSFKAETILI